MLDATSSKEHAKHSRRIRLDVLEKFLPVLYSVLLYNSAVSLVSPLVDKYWSYKCSR